MSIIGTNSANNLTSQLIPGLQGVKTADGTVLTDNSLNIISMLSESSNLISPPKTIRSFFIRRVKYH